MTKFYTHFSKLGNRLFVKEVDGKIRKQHKIPIKPSLYVKADTDDVSGFTTLYGDKLTQFDFDTCTAAREFVDSIGNTPVFGYNRFEYVAAHERYPGKSVEFDPSMINVGIFDIETECANGFPDPEKAEEIVNAITISINRKKYVISTFDYNAPDGVEFIHAKNEAALLAHFVKLWVKSDLDIISGWNIDFFDIPYMYNRITKILGEKFANALSPVNKVSSRKVNTKFGQRTKINITGVESLDYQQLYEKFTYTPRSSMKLDYIAHCELGEKKIDYSEEGGKLHLLYLNNPQKFLDYNLHDVVLVERLDDKLKLIGLAQTLAFRMKVNFGDVFSQVRMWEVKMSNNMVDRGIQPEYSSDNRKTEKFKGAFVKVPNVGYYRNVCSFDLTSLYPKIIEQNNISPETMLDPTQFFNIDDDVVSYDHDKMAISLAKAIEMNAVIASNGSLYDKTTKGLFPTIVAEVFDERVVAKNKMKEAKTQLQKATTDEDKTFWDQKVVQHNNEQLAAKIQINSLYGALGNEHFRWFNLHQAKAVTFTGQAVIKWIEVKMNEYMNNLLKTEDIDYVIYCDTDSAYLDVTAVVDRIVGDKELSHNQITDIVDRFAQEKIEPMIERSYEEFAERTNAFENAMHMKREVIGSGVFMAKKKYIMRIYDDEGVRLAKPKMKIMGHEAIRSQTPDWIRERMVNLLEMVFTSTNDAAVNYLYDVKDEYESLSIDDVAETSGINELDKYTNAAGMPAKGAQSHIRAAIYYNKFIKQFEIDKDFVSIKEGDKIKLLTLNKRLNPLGLDIIGYPEQLPKEFGLHEFVDYDAMYQKLMLDPVKRVYDIVGWKTTKQKNLLDLMGMN